MEQNSYVIIDETGIHTRSATMSVQTVSKFDSDIQLEHNGKKVNLKSIMGVTSLGVGKDVEITIYADGSDESDVTQVIGDVLSREGSIR